MIAHDRIDELARLAPSPPGVDVCSCDEALALRRELAATRAKLAEAERRPALAAGAAEPPLAAFDAGDFRVFCPACGVGGRFDEDGCCAGCGASVCTVGDVEVHLARVGLLIDRPVEGGAAAPAFGNARQRAIADGWRSGGGDGID